MDKHAEHLAANLKLMCNRYPSIAHICRKMKINRQQFNKYLSGQSKPSLHSLHRISLFFGVDEAELLLPHDEFTRTVFSRPNSMQVPQIIMHFFTKNREQMAFSLKELKRYRGFYYGYHRSPDWPGCLVKTLFVISQDQELTYGETIAHLSHIDSTGINQRAHRVKSLIFYDASRLYALQRDSSHKDGGNSFMIVYPTDHPVQTFLPGLLMSLSMAGDRKPFATRILFEFLGKNIDVKSCLKSCAIYPDNHKGISIDIWRRSENVILDAGSTLLPDI